MIEANRIKLGIFITFGAIVILAGIFVFGLSQFFKDKIGIYTVFTNSVDGLSVGSPVRYNGVTLGVVKDIFISDNGDIGVYMEIYLDALDKKASKQVNVLIAETKSDKGDRNKLIERGLRCSIQLRGISGDKYISLGFYEGARYKSNLNTDIEFEEYFYVPALETYMPFAIDNICRILENISTINFNEVANNVNKDLNSLHLLAQKLELMFNKIQVEEINNSLLSTLNQIDETANSINTLTDNLSNNPSEVVWGRKDKPMFTDPQ